MNERMKRCLLSLALLGSITVHAEPETRLRFDSSMEGVDNGGRFGAEVACSRPVVDAGSSSIVAIAAPNAIGGQGRVYLFDPVRPAAPIQVISPGSEQTAGRFGTAIQFIDDINGDLIDDLVVGAPGTPTASDGGVYLFTSAISQVGLRYAACAMMQGPQGFGASLQALRAAGGQSSANVVVSNPRLARTDGFAVSAQSNGSCQFVPTSDFSETFIAASEWGSSISQVGSGATQGLISILVAAPAVGEHGIVYQRVAAQSELQAPVGSLNQLAEHEGLVVSSQHNSSNYVIGSPQADEGRGSVAVYDIVEGAAQPRCILSNPQEEYSAQFGSNVQHLGSSFSEMFSSAQEVIALRNAESSTGGALDLVGVTGNGCSGLVPVNNCRTDPQQEQGLALAGGTDCQAFLNGRMQRILVLGSPGWSGQSGRVDLAFEQGMFDVSYSCSVVAGLTLSPVSGSGYGVTQVSVAGVITPTPIAAATATLESTATAVATATVASTATATAIPTDSATATYSATATAAATATLESMATAVATATVASTSTATAIPTDSATATYSATATAAATATLESTATAVATATAASTTAATAIPTDSATATYSATATPMVVDPIVNSPESPATASPTPTGSQPGASDPEIEIRQPGTNGAGSSNTDRTNDTGAGGKGLMIVSPGSGGLPAPSVVVRPGEVQVEMPQVQPQLTLQQQNAMIRQLQKQRRISRNKATQMLNDPNNIEVTYIVRYWEVSSSRRFALIQSAHAQDSSGRGRKIKQVRTRSNKITLRNLRPGAVFGLSYSVELSTKKPRSRLGVTQASPTVTFRVD